MPLISLPTELLLEITGLLGEPEHDLLNDYYTLSNRRDCLALAATCRVTRRAAVSVLYTHIVLDPNKTWVFTLQEILTSDPAAASSVRHLILAPPENRCLPAWSSPKDLLRSYRQILNSCSGIQTLLVTAHIADQSLSIPGSKKPAQCIEKDRVKHKSQTNSGWEVVPRKRNNYAHMFWKKPGNDMSRLFSSIHSHSQKKITLIEFRGVSTSQLWKHLQRLEGFTNLETLIIKDCLIDDFNSQEFSDMHLKLPVKTLSIEIEDINEPLQFDEDSLAQENAIGDIFASLFPHVRTLILHAPEGIIYGALKKYISIGKSLTHLSLCPRVSMFGSTHLCGMISALAPRLTHFIVSKGNETEFCHKLFAGEWKHLQQLILNDCTFPFTCDSSDLTIDLFHLLNSRPAAKIAVLGLCVYVHPSSCGCVKDLKLVWKEPWEEPPFVDDKMFSPPEGWSDSESEIDPTAVSPALTAYSSAGVIEPQFLWV